MVPLFIHYSFTHAKFEIVPRYDICGLATYLIAHLSFCTNFVSVEQTAQGLLETPQVRTEAPDTTVKRHKQGTDKMSTKGDQGYTSKQLQTLAGTDI